MRQGFGVALMTPERSSVLAPGPFTAVTVTVASSAPRVPVEKSTRVKIYRSPASIQLAPHFAQAVPFPNSFSGVPPLPSARTKTRACCAPCVDQVTYVVQSCAPGAIWQGFGLAEIVPVAAHAGPGAAASAMAASKIGRYSRFVFI